MRHRPGLAAVFVATSFAVACTTAPHDPDPAESSEAPLIVADETTYDECIVVDESEVLADGTAEEMLEPSPDPSAAKCDWTGEKETHNDCHWTYEYYKDPKTGKMCRGKQICSGRAQIETCTNGKITGSRYRKCSSTCQ